MQQCKGCGTSFCAKHVESCGACARGGRRSLHCDEGQREACTINCSGAPQPCVLCGQSVCELHAAAANASRPGHGHKCTGQCATEDPGRCSGLMQGCPGCDRSFCTYHSQQSGTGRSKGGHLCSVYCQTSVATRDNCCGEIKLCEHCPHRFCDYHYEPCTSVWQLMGGHVCKECTPGATADNAGWDAFAGGQEQIAHRADSVFEGRVFRGGRGNICVVSFPGKFIKMWGDLVRSGRDRELSTACVFLPNDDPKGRHGQHTEDPERNGRCYCHGLYGSPKPWGCRWFHDWLANVNAAVRLQLELVVVFFPGKVDCGVVEWEDLAVAGDDLWAKPGGLGGSQKGEVAWLRKHGHAYRSMDTGELSRECGLAHD